MARRDFSRTILLSMRVWDGPTRLCHWLIVLAVGTSAVAAELGAMRAHRGAGYVALGLLLFRIAWGFVGSDTARFSRLLTSPTALARDLRHLGERVPDTGLGPTPANGWIGALLLLLLALEILSGLGDPAGPEAGPFAARLGPGLAQACLVLHRAIFIALLAAVAVHVLLLLAYAVGKGQNLLMPMLTGRKRLAATTRQPRMASPGRALLVAVLAGGLAALLALLA